MAYVRVVDPLLNNNKPGRSTDVIQLRDNQDDFNSRILAVESLVRRGDQDIRDDFISKDTTVNTDNWVTEVGGGDTVTIVSEHTMRCLLNNNTASDYAGVKATTKKLRIDKTHEYIAFFEARVVVPGTLQNHYQIGWNDDSLGAAGASFFDKTDSVVIARNPSDSWNLHCSLGGTSATLNSLQACNTMAVMRVEFTCSATAGNRQAEVFVNGISKGVISTDANFPTAVLRPICGTRGDTTGAASREMKVDYLDFGFMAHPLAA